VLSNLGESSRLGALRLKAFKARFSVIPELLLNYSDGEFTTDSHGQAKSTTEMLQALLIANPRIRRSDFENLASEKGFGRNSARTFLDNAVLGGRVRLERGTHNTRYHTWVESEAKNGLNF